jgi:hypothetical protein
MKTRLRIPASEPHLTGEPLPLYLSEPTELRLQLVGEEAWMDSGRRQLAGQRRGAPALTAALAADACTELLAKCFDPQDHQSEYPEAPSHDYRTH